MCLERIIEIIADHSAVIENDTSQWRHLLLLLCYHYYIDCRENRLIDNNRVENICNDIELLRQTVYALRLSQ